jgi:glutamine amidotransferase
MCRWLAYSGGPLVLSEILYSHANSMIDQSLHAKLGAEATNGDGFGVGWYDDQPTPGVFKSVEPAWNDQNLKEVAEHVRSGHAFAHLRAAIGSPVQQTNCHPFRYDGWLFMHNGFIGEFAKVKRDLVMAVDPSLYPEIKGSADSEILFYLALTLGLQDNPPDAIARALGIVEDLGARHGVQYPFQGTIATTDGERIWALRYSSEGKSRSLFTSQDVPMLRRQHPDREFLQELPTDARLIVSEPIGDLPGAWREVPESSHIVVSGADEEITPFKVIPPARLQAV